MKMRKTDFDPIAVSQVEDVGDDLCTAEGASSSVLTYLIVGLSSLLLVIDWQGFFNC